MTLLEALKQLAEKFPEKWEYYDDLHFVMFRRRGCAYETILAEYDCAEKDWCYSTEDCDAILAEHGLVMWVEQEPEVKAWWGFVFRGIQFILECEDFPTKRAATEATFLAALEYILKDKP